MIVFERSTRRISRNLAAHCIALGIFCASPVSAESQQEILLFPSIDTFDSFSESSPAAKDSYVRGSLDIVYSYSGDRFRFLGEYLWSSSEAELERLKAGWRWRDDSMVWLGRFHATAKYWTTEYHHGQFLQTSITRPSLEEWEDESGPIPSHITGLALEMDRSRDDKSTFSYALSAGLAPKFGEEGLIPYDLLDPRSGHGLGLNARFGYRPQLFSPMQLGFIAGWNEINVVSESSPSLTDLNRIDQLTIGGFADWRWKNLRLITSWVHFENDLKFVDGTVHDKFLLGYVQFEYEASDVVTFFGRTDNGIDEDNSPYLQLLPEFIAHRHMLGVRWDFVKFQSLTMEVADTSQQGDMPDHDNFKEIRFQWSAVFP